MTLVNRSALYVQDTTSWIYLPPFGYEANITRNVRQEKHDMPFGATIIQSRVAGWNIDVSGIYKETSPSAGMLFQDALRAAFFDDDLNSRLVDIQCWADSTGSIKRTYRNCQLDGDVEFSRAGARTQSIGTFNFSLVSRLTAPYASVTGSITAPEGPYEAYLYNGNAEAVATVSYNSIDIAFMGAIAEVTGATNTATHQIEITPNMDRAVRITAIEIINCAGMFGTTGSTTIRVSSTNYESAGSGIDATVAYNVTKVTPVQGSFTVIAGAKIYVYITAAGNHLSPQVRIHTEVL